MGIKDRRNGNPLATVANAAMGDHAMKEKQMKSLAVGNRSGYERLAAAICIQAAEDFREARKQLKDPDKYVSITRGDRDAIIMKAYYTISEVERFFLSERGQMFSFGKGEYILEKLRNEEV